MSLTISKNSFYGSRIRTRATKIKVKLEKRVREYKHQPVPQRYKKGLHQSTSWKIFYRQQDAFNFMRKWSNQDLHVFSFESQVFFEHHGQRLYLLTTYDHFWHYYRQLPSGKRHYYEVIPEGAVCKLYFDLEFNRGLNPKSNAGRMVETFIKVIQFHLEKYFNVISSRDHILQLDSSTDEKFSQHLIFCPPEVVFKDNINAGCFVKKICIFLEAVAENRWSFDDESGHSNFFEECNLSLQDIRDLFVENRNGSQTLFCDTGVYTKNRNFRLYLSSKLNKKTALTLAMENRYPSLSSTKSEELDLKKIFFLSLIANVKYKTSLKVLTYNDALTARRKNIKGNDVSENPRAEGYLHSPYIEIDSFVERVISQHDMKGKIRRWSYFHEAELLVYDISNNRWCHNIGRQHRSNNIMLLVDIRKGVYYQKCHDPDCKAVDYKSEEWKLPENILPGYYIQGEVLEGSFDSPESHKGCLTENDFATYFDAEEMSVRPEWFNEDPFERENNFTLNAKKDIDCKDKNNHISVSINTNTLTDFSENYIDPSWFDEDFNQE